jgi:hypothetical protein
MKRKGCGIDLFLGIEHIQETEKTPMPDVLIHSPADDDDDDTKST